MQSYEFKSVYHKQLDLIESYNKNHYFLDIIQYIKQSVIAIIPETLRKYLRKKYLNIKFRGMDC